MEKQRIAKVEDIELYLNEKGEFRINTLNHVVEFRPKGAINFVPITDHFVNTLWMNMSTEKNMKVNKEHLYNVIHSSFAKEYDPLNEYFHHLPAWDGTDYIGQLADMVKVKGCEGESDESAHEWFKLCLKKWIVGMVASINKDNSTNHLVLILLGKQGIYKTTWLTMILPEELRQYCYIKTNSSKLDKDDKIKTTENIMVILEEIDNMTKVELNELKAVITQTVINERRPYGRNSEKLKKIASFCGTGNNIQILTDDTGNRRFLPFEVISIENPRTHQYNYEGIYSQALHLLNNGFQYWLDADEMKEQARLQANFEQPSMEEELIMTHYRRPIEGEEGKWLMASHILSNISMYVRNQLSTRKLGIVLSKLGFEKKRLAEGTCYRLAERSGAEINKGCCAIEPKDDSSPF